MSEYTSRLDVFAQNRIIIAEVFVKRGLVLVKHNSLSQPIELPVLFRATGVESDQEMLQMVGVDFAAELAPSLQQSRQLSVKTLGDGKVYAVPTTLTAAQVLAVRVHEGRDQARRARQLLSAHAILVRNLFCGQEVEWAPDKWHQRSLSTCINSALRARMYKNGKRRALSTATRASSICCPSFTANVSKCSAHSAIMLAMISIEM